MNIPTILADIHALEQELLAFERQYCQERFRIGHFHRFRIGHF